MSGTHCLRLIMKLSEHRRDNPTLPAPWPVTCSLSLTQTLLTHAAFLGRHPIILASPTSWGLLGNLNLILIVSLNVHLGSSCRNSTLQHSAWSQWFSGIVVRVSMIPHLFIFHAFKTSAIWMMLLGFDDRSMDHSCSSLCLLVLGKHFPSSYFLGAGDSSNILALGSLLWNDFAFLQVWGFDGWGLDLRVLFLLSSCREESLSLMHQYLQHLHMACHLYSPCSLFVQPSSPDHIFIPFCSTLFCCRPEKEQ